MIITLKHCAIVTEKLLAIVTQILILNLAVIAASTLSIFAVEASADGKTLALLYLAYFLMQLEIAAITFGISASIRRGGLGIGLGLAAVFYFVIIIANLMEETKMFKYFTPFGFTDGADIIGEKAIHFGYLSASMAVGVLCVAVAYEKYRKKDIV